MIKSFFSRQFFTFILTGGVAAVVNFCSRIFFNQYMSYSSAIVVAYLSGMLTAFILAKCFVFKNGKQRLSHSAMIFCLINLFAITQTWLVSMLLVRYLPSMQITQFVPEISHAVGIIIPVFTSYVGHKRWSFR